MRECIKCKSTEHTNKSLVLMINECGHPLCRTCVDHLYARNAAPCHVCGRMLRKNTFWEQVFDDPIIEKENFIRKRLKKVFNLMEEDFPSLREYNDYLEQVETYVVNLANDIDVEITEKEIEAFRERHAEEIERNRRRLDKDQQWIEQNLREEREMKARVTEMHHQEQKEQVKDVIQEKKAIMEELRDSQLPAEVILDRERKRQIEAELEEKEREARRKRRNKEISESRRRRPITKMTWGDGQANAAAGQPFIWTAPDLPYNGPSMPEISALEEQGFLMHMRPASPHKVAGGFTTDTGCIRALREARWDLLEGCS